MVRRWIGLTVVTGAALTLFANGFVIADEKPTVQKPKVAAAEKAEEKKAIDPFEAPEGTDSKVLELFLQRLMNAPPKSRQPEAILEHLIKLEKVADELLTRELEEPMFEQVVNMKISVLAAMPRFGDQESAKRLTEYLTQAAEDTRPTVSTLAKQYLKMQRIQQIGDLKPAERNALVQQLAKDIQEGELSEDEFRFAMMAGEGIIQSGETEEGIAAMNLFAKYLEANADPNSGKMANMLRGKGRRLGLMGNAMEITGTTVDGKPFQLDSLKGKVVLVDFWATWCGPCRGEFPNMREQYTLYHDKGFEIVGVSLDDDRPALEEFLAEEKLPWMQIHQNDGNGHENAERYAIEGIPACFLIDQEGKVVSLNCRGEVLPEMLAKLLGPVEKQAEATEAPEKPGKSK